MTLVWLGAGPAPAWPLGRSLNAGPTPSALAECLARESSGTEAAWVFWSARAGVLDPERVLRALAGPEDVWHAGLKLGLAGLPRAIDFVAPTWMLNRDPSPELEATSWRLSLEACVVRSEVLRQLGGVRAEFQSLDGAGLELGHRWISRGALMRHCPDLLAGPPAKAHGGLPLEDEMRFVYYRFGRFWLRWSLGRALLHRYVGPWRARGIRRRLEATPAPAPSAPLHVSTVSVSDSRPAPASITVLIPTVDRYPYLEKLLGQLRNQTVPPLEIVVVDQTPADRRRSDLSERFPDLPLKVFQLDQAGQCSSRNLGLEASKGDYFLLLDDDDEVPPDIVERHLRSLRRFRNQVSCGVALEDGAGALPEAFRVLRVSDVFPAGNSMVSRAALGDSGLFDLAYERGARADADLGMRLYLSGQLMVLDPEVEVLHRHAPRGGLRTHGARVVTYASSRKRLLHRQMPGATELYLAKRYFSPRQVREMLWLQASATLAFKGSRGRRALKAVLGLLLLPDTFRKLRRRERDADAMMAAGPRIPMFRSLDTVRRSLVNR
ncbi:MAG TPA: glycosyltransferase family A protein [Thermoanaerobaculia bacterium]|nr:glycosyltransferase family A protein [Thermoanaerobaculia bacterium]